MGNFTFQIDFAKMANSQCGMWDTIEELLHSAEVKMPPQFGTFKQAQKLQQPEAKQAELGFG